MAAIYGTAVPFVEGGQGCGALDTFTRSVAVGGGVSEIGGLTYQPTNNDIFAVDGAHLQILGYEMTVPEHAQRIAIKPLLFTYPIMLTYRMYFRDIDFGPPLHGLGYYFALWRNDETQFIRNVLWAQVQDRKDLGLVTVVNAAADFDEGRSFGHVTAPLVYEVWYKIRIYWDGNIYRCRLWLESEPEPDDWPMDVDFRTLTFNGQLFNWDWGQTRVLGWQNVAERNGLGGLVPYIDIDDLCIESGLGGGLSSTVVNFAEVETPEGNRGGLTTAA